MPDESPIPGDSPLRRRTLLGAVGLGAAAATAGTVAGAPAARAAAADPLAAWTLDTLTGLAVFVLPGPDPYSRNQGTPRTEPGGVEARLPEFLVDALDRYLPAPVVAAYTDALLAGAPALLGGVRAGGALPVKPGSSIPLSPLVALLLNIEALRVRPASLVGPFRSPFARLTYADKARVFELLEGADADLVAALDAGLPEPLKRTASGLLRFLGGALMELSALGGLSEWGVYDAGTRTLTGKPVGWTLTGYVPAAEGRPEFRGYYQGRREATG
ncbi:hypothetical protein [Actinomadura parmotrematis]|uniref:Gluconate 2-dehydrogenase subunit 3 family protein n=1 Tax=Actinomadura parmotrematis TaxID=2864039 RepID=A0ABS7FRZ4_9ACTN|nr:hypothetical protein [Actinomadura parmotrematis]MBW8483167.1 hypothetical protein [Actinomadura parmotrematis]